MIADGRKQIHETSDQAYRIELAGEFIVQQNDIGMDKQDYIS